jgi:transcriptional regulator with XRE-family HTH domain
MGVDKNGFAKLSLREIIRRRRQDLGLTQLDVARATGIASPDFISLVEKGVRRLDLDRIPQLVQLLRLDAVELCKLALEEQYPVLTAALVKGKAIRTRSSGKLSTEVDLAAERLLSLPPSARTMVMNMINLLYDKEKDQALA